MRPPSLSLSPLLALALLTCCGGEKPQLQTQTQSNPQPKLSAISPTNIVVGAYTLSILVTGTGFLQSSVVQWNGQPRPTTFNSGTQLAAALSTADLALAGTFSIVVFTPAPGGGTSTSAIFTINNAQPVVTSATPPFLSVGDSGTLVVSGTGFATGSVAKWNGVPRATTFLSSTQLSISLSATDTTAPRLNSISVTNPPPGGGASNSLTVATNSPLPPSVALLVPASATAGASQLGVRVYGQNLGPNSIVSWNGSARATQFVNPGLVIASVSANDVAQIGTATVTAASPSVPGAKATATASAALPFAVQAASPTVIQRVSIATDDTDSQCSWASKNAPE